MIIGILGLVFVIVAAIYTYRTAKSNGHNAVLWTLAAVAAGFGVQIILPLLIGIILTVYWLATGRSVEEVQTLIETPGNIIGIICLFASIVGVVLILRRVSLIREDDAPLPPPSPEFYQNQQNRK